MDFLAPDVLSKCGRAVPADHPALHRTRAASCRGHGSPDQGPRSGQPGQRSSPACAGAGSHTGHRVRSRTHQRPNGAFYGASKYKPASFTLTGLAEKPKFLARHNKDSIVTVVKDQCSPCALFPQGEGEDVSKARAHYAARRWAHVVCLPDALPWPQACKPRIHHVPPKVGALAQIVRSRDEIGNGSRALMRKAWITAPPGVPRVNNQQKQSANDQRMTSERGACVWSA
jgi:hypothetical protein